MSQVHHFITSITLAAAAPPCSSVIVVGGSSGMGKACASAIVNRGGHVMLVSRSLEKLQSAKLAILAANPDLEATRVQTQCLDASEEEQVAKFASKLPAGEWDGLCISAAGTAPHGAITALATADTKELFSSKFWVAYHCCKYIGPKLADGGAIAMVAGVLNRRPGINCVPLATVNGALEGLTRALALEFGPRLRVNALSPGFCDTERFDHIPANKKAAMLANTADSLPLKRVGQPKDMGQALDFLLSSPFTTGIVLDCDGGHAIRQYANSATDPMRMTAQRHPPPMASAVREVR
mmetsp:Transcript_9098/g.15249  ORF Transcript_9098/g.15249 Transcript_9098/m.15249 type:complete len:295 (-) Transcript_9098:72-956(-)